MRRKVVVYQGNKQRDPTQLSREDQDFRSLTQRRFHTRTHGKDRRYARSDCNVLGRYGKHALSFCLRPANYKENL